MHIPLIMVSDMEVYKGITMNLLMDMRFNNVPVVTPIIIPYLTVIKNKTGHKITKKIITKTHNFRTNNTQGM